MLETRSDQEGKKEMERAQPQFFRITNTQAPYILFCYLDKVYFSHCVFGFSVKLLCVAGRAMMETALCTMHVDMEFFGENMLGIAAIGECDRI